jgi:hypothetical protein
MGVVNSEEKGFKKMLMAFDRFIVKEEKAL